MNKAAKIAIVSVALLVPIVVLASKAKNALNKITFRITGFSILGLTAGGLRVRFRSEFVNDTGQSFSVNDLLSKLLYKDSIGIFTEFARAANIPTVEFVNAVPKTIDSVFIIDILQIPKLFKTDSFRVATYFTVLGIEQSLVTDMKITDLKVEVANLISKTAWIPSVIKNLVTNKKSFSGYNPAYVAKIHDLDPSQYQVV